MLDGDIVGHLYQHTHPHDLHHSEVMKVTAQIKIKAMDTQETPQQIIAKVVTFIAADAAMQMPAIRTIRNNVFCKLALSSLYGGITRGK